MLFIGASEDGGTSAILLTVFIITLVCSYNIAAIYVFGKTLLRAALKQRQKRKSAVKDDASTIVEKNDEAEENSNNNVLTQIHPVRDDSIVDYSIASVTSV